MVAIVGGNGGNGLGLDNTSGQLGSPGVQGTSATGQAGEHLFLNAATGTDTALLRTYNSLGKRTDNNTDNWQMSVVRTVGSLTGTVNTVGSTITRTEGDGSSRVFTFDTARNLYVNRDGQDAFDTLAFAGNTWTHTDGATQAKNLAPARRATDISQSYRPRMSRSTTGCFG